MLGNMAASLFIEGSIVTTTTKAKSGSLNDRRLVVARLPHKEAVTKLFNELGPKYADRNGGYTRIVKLGARVGDASEMAVIQLVD
jgi:large subunit ribosomal protein L17